MLHKRLGLHAYKVQFVQELQPNDTPKCNAFATEFLTRIDEDSNFSDDHSCGKVKEHKRDTPKVNTGCCLINIRVSALFSLPSHYISNYL